MIQKIKKQYSSTQPLQSQSQEKITLNILLGQHSLVYFDATTRSGICIYIPLHAIFFTTCHYRLAESFFNSSLLEIFGYETPSKHTSDVGKDDLKAPTVTGSVLARTSNILITAYYFAKNVGCLFNFTKTTNKYPCSMPVEPEKHLSALEFFFKNAVWLERELREMLGVILAFKSDNRCLLLLYGSSDFPIRKLFPTQGHRELYYSRTTDSITSTPLGAQY